MRMTAWRNKQTDNRGIQGKIHRHMKKRVEVGVSVGVSVCEREGEKERRREGEKAFTDISA